MAEKSKTSYQYDLIFLLGDGKTLVEEIDKEAQREDDILIGGFIDNYENLPIKTYLGYQYFAEVNCIIWGTYYGGNSYSICSYMVFSSVLGRRLLFFKTLMLL